jgi:hypothetical protein
MAEARKGAIENIEAVHLASNEQAKQSAMRAEEIGGAKRGGFFSAERGIQAVYYLVGFVIIGLVFYKLQYSTESVCCGDYDGYYHIKWSRLLWESLKSGHLLPPTFTWLPLTSLNPNDYVDHHYLFHVLQIPFTWFFELTTAAKISALLFGTLAVFSCYWLIVHYQTRYTLLWLLALLTASGPFLYRMNMAKAPPLALIFLMVGAYLLFESRYVLLAPLMFLFVWSYSLFPLLWVGAIVWFLVILWSEERIEWRPVLWTTIGMVVGLVINPYFPKNLKLHFAHLVMKAGNSSVQVGGEWYPYNSWELFTNSFIAFVAMLIGYLTFRRLDKKMSARALFFLIMSTILMIATFHTKRFVEYWPPFAILFAAFSLQAFLTAWQTARQTVAPAKLPNELLDDLSQYLDQPSAIELDKQEQQKQTILQAGAFALSAILLFILIVNVRGIHSERLGINGQSVSKEIEEMPKPETYQKGMKWIKDNVPAGQVIFNTDWDDFPKMFFYGTTHAYVSGLDPGYLHRQHEDLSNLYINITLGKIEDPGPIIRDKFGATFVFSDNDHDDFYANAIESGWFDKVYEDADCFILKLRDKKGEPPSEIIDESGPQPDSDKPDDANEPTEPDEEPPSN